MGKEIRLTHEAEKIWLSSEHTRAVPTDSRGGGGESQVTRPGGEECHHIISQGMSRLTSACIFDIGHLCYGQLTAVKTRYLLTSIT